MERWVSEQHPMGVPLTSASLQTATLDRQPCKYSFSIVYVRRQFTSSIHDAFSD